MTDLRTLLVDRYGLWLLRYRRWRLWLMTSSNRVKSAATTTTTCFDVDRRCCGPAVARAAPHSVSHTHGHWWESESNWWWLILKSVTDYRAHDHPPSRMTKTATLFTNPATSWQIDVREYVNTLIVVDLSKPEIDSSIDLMVTAVLPLYLHVRFFSFSSLPFSEFFLILSRNKSIKNWTLIQLYWTFQIKKQYEWF